MEEEIIKAPPIAPIDPTLDAGNIGEQQINVPVPEMTDLNALAQSFQTQATQSTAQETKAGEDVTSIMSMLEGQTADQIAAEDAQGVSQLSKELLALQNQARQQETEFLASFMNQEGKRQTRAETSVAQQNLQRQRAVDVMLTNSLLSAKQGNLAFAQNQADRAIAIKYEPLKARLQTKQEILRQISGRASEDRQKALSLQMRQIEKREAEEKQAESFILNALTSNAPSKLVTQARDALKNGGTPSDVASILGRYSLSEGERLSQDLQRAQINRINFEMQQARDAKAQAVIAETQAKQQQIPAVKKELDAINGLLANTQGIQQSTGLTKLGRLFRPLSPKGIKIGLGGIKPSFGITGNLASKADFIGSVSNLISTGTLNTLIEAKKQGATFGALSDAELAKLEESFSKLGAWAVTKNGKITGFKATDDLIVQELNRIAESTTKMYSELGGVLEPGTPIGINKADAFVNDLDSIIQGSNYENSGYIF